MADKQDIQIEITDPELQIIDQEKKSALNYRERRHADWNENYALYRDKVITNRLIQRQTINIPLMKYGISTVLKDVEESPMIYFRSLSDDEQKEIYYNARWSQSAKDNKLPVRDKIDKKQAMLYGRTFKKQNIENGKWTFEIIDPQDMLIERHIDPADIDTARSVIQTGIFRTLKEIEENKDYDKSEIKRLKTYFDEETRTEESESNLDAFNDRQQRMADMGLIDVFDPVVGETYIELNEVYRKEYDEDLKEIVIFLYVVASTRGGLYKLSKTRLCDLLGETKDNFWYDHYPFSSWAPDTERTDFWSDGHADILRQPNKALNSWISQLVENRTLRNFNMHYYDSSNAEFVPQTFIPEPWGWYPIPGNPADVIKDVMVGDLSESLDEMQFVIGIAEKAIAASSVQTGDVEGGQITLGEIQLALVNAQARTKGMEKYYTESWRDFAVKYMKLLEGAGDMLDDMEVEKKGRETKKVYKKTINQKMWFDKEGYAVEVRTKEDKQMDDASQLQKLEAAKSMMPDNPALSLIIKKRMLEFAGLNSDEMKEVLDAEEQQQEETLGTPPEELPPGMPPAEMAAPPAAPPQVAPVGV